MLRLLVVAAAAVVLVSACSRDLTFPGAPLRGKVVGSVDTQGHIRSEDEPVLLVANDGAQRSVTTSAGGAFVFTDVPPGTHTLSLQLPGFAPLLVPGVVVTHGASTDAGVLTPLWLENTPQQAVVQGKVVVAGGGDPNGGQVAFYLKPVNQLIALAPIGLEGVFVQRVPPGSYDLKASHPLYVTADLPDLVVDAGAALDLSSSPISLALNPATLTGTVLKERDGQAPVPAVGALITLADGNTTTTDSAGNFNLTGLAAGTQPARVQLAGYHEATDGHLVTLKPGQTTALGTVSLLLDRGAISGTVALADHAPALDVTVALTGVPYNSLVTPDQANPWQGTFLIANVPVGTYEVTATKSRYSRAVAGSVPVAANATTTAGTLTLALLQGDFVITGDLNIPGYTRTSQVTLDLSRFSGAASYRASEDSTFTGVAFSPYTGSKYPFTLGGTQGTHTVYAQYKDGAGTVSSTSSSQIVLDSRPPSNPSLVLNGGAPFTNVPNPLFLTLQADNPVPSGVDAVSALATVLLNETGTTLDGGNPFDGGAVLLATTSVPYQRDLAFVRASSGDGAQAVYAQFVDQAGNVSPAVRATIGVDTVVPSGSIAIADGAAATAHGYTSSALVTVTENVVAKANGDAILIRLANSQAALATAVYQPVSASSSWFLDPTVHGPVTLYAQLRDQAGNTSGQLTAGITFDVTPPNPAAATLVGSATTRGPSVTISLSAADDRAMSPTQAVTASESAFFQGTGTVGPQAFPGTSQLSFPLSTGDGPKTIYVRFRDAAGNDSVTSVPVTLKATPPTGSLTLTGALADGTPSTTITATTAVSVQLTTGGGATGYLLGNETLTSCPASGYTTLTTSTVPFTLSGTASPRVVALCLTDAAGNTAGPFTATIPLDTAAPASCALGLAGRKVDGTAAPAGRTATTLVTGTFTGCSTTPTDVVLSTTPVTCTAVASLPWQPYAASLPVQLAGPDGVNTISGCVRDAARNPASFTAGTITLQTRPPTAPTLVLDNGAAYVNAAQVTARGGNVASARGTAAGASEWSLSETGSFSTWSSYTGANPQNFTFGGTGVRTLAAVFRDDLGNTSPAASATITIDTAAPDGGALGIVTPTANAFTSTPAVTLALTSAPADAVQLKVASAASSAACAASDLASAVAQPFAPNLAFVLPGGDGLKRVCLQLLDAAGNPGPILGAAVTLDTVPPTAPVLVTPDAILDGGSLGAGAVTVSIVPGSASDLNFARFERVGGDATAWTTASTSAATTSFTFTLTANPAYEQGVPNLLQVRAVDQAGNAGAAGSVVFTVDASRPSAVTLQSTWVNNANRQASLLWRASGSPDVAAYRVYYGGASGTYNGQYASDGPSPVTVGNVTAATLSGLINASPTYAMVKPVDRAGNEGAASAEVVLQPNAVALNYLGSVALANPGMMLALNESTLYVLEQTFSGSYGAALQAVDLSTLTSPIQGGSIVTPAPTLPTATAAQAFADGITSSVNADTMDLQVDGTFLFMADGTRLRIFDLTVPLAPNKVVDFDTGFPAQALQVRGSTLFVGGRDYTGGCVAARAGVSAYDLSSLYDHNAATKPAAGSLLGRTTNGTCSGNPYGGLMWTRNQVVQLEAGSATWNVAPALNRAAWGNANLQTQLGLKFNPYSNADPVSSGNLAYFSGLTGLQVVPLNNVWAGQAFADQTPLAAMAIRGGGQIDLAGGELFVSDISAGAVRTFGLDEFVASGTIADLGLVRPPSGSQGGVVHYGNYLLAVNGSSVDIYEVATPRAVHQVAQSTAGRQSHLVSGSFLYSSGSVLDLQGGSPPPTLGAAGAGAFYQSAFIDENEVLAEGSVLRVNTYEAATDRDPATVYDFNQQYTVAMPANVFATGVAAWGSYLVVAEKQTAGTVGTYLEVFDARNLRGRVAGSRLALANSVDRFFVAAATGQAEVKLYKGRAIVALEGATPAVYIVDLRPDFTDGTAGLVATALQATVLPSAGGTAPWSAVVQGNYLYFTTYSGLEVVDVSQAFDESAATTVPGAPPRTLFSTDAASVDVHGSYAVLVPRGSGGVQVLDVSTPLSPRVLSSTPFTATFGCWFIDGTCINLRSQVSVHGTRAYATTGSGSYVFELN